MKIAVYVDGNGAIASPYGEGCIRLYDDDTAAWTPIKDVPFTIRPDMKLADVKTAIREAAAQLDGCGVFLAAETRGLVYSIFQDELGFHTWRSQGPLPHQLDVVRAKEEDIAATRAAAAVTGCATSCSSGCHGPRKTGDGPSCGPVTPTSLERVDDGYYRIDLGALLKRDPALNSRTALLPTMEGKAFEKLEILCDHIPRWFSRALLEMDLRADFDVSGQGVKVLVFPNH